jgi:hypothetical protein
MASNAGVQERSECRQISHHLTDRPLSFPLLEFFFFLYLLGVACRSICAHYLPEIGPGLLGLSCGLRAV